MECQDYDNDMMTLDVDDDIKIYMDDDEFYVDVDLASNTIVDDELYNRSWIMNCIIWKNFPLCKIRFCDFIPQSLKNISKHFANIKIK